MIRFQLGKGNKNHSGIKFGMWFHHVLCKLFGRKNKTTFKGHELLVKRIN